MRTFLTKDNMTVKISLLLTNSAPFSITAFLILYDILRLGKLKYNLNKNFHHEFTDTLYLSVHAEVESQNLLIWGTNSFTVEDMRY